MKKRSQWNSVLALAFTVLAFSASTAWGQVPDRRKDQFPTDFAYLIFPAPYSLPGIGQGAFIIGYLANVFESPTDIYAYKITGDAKGQGVGIQEIPLGTRALMLQVGREDISKVQVNQYFSRGMESHKVDYFLVDVSEVTSRYNSLSLNLFDRRVELAYNTFSQEASIDAVRDYEGNILYAYAPAQKQKGKDRSASLLLDLTDDYSDPREGVRILYDRSLPYGREALSDPEYHVENVMVNGYVPLGRVNTLAVDYFRSQAKVTATGEVDPAVVTANFCGPTPDPACIAASQPLIDGELAHNRYGTARSMGGRDRLRAYPDGRFQGAQAEYIGLEFRWNYSEEVTPFNWWIWKDTRTGLQTAFIAEAGTVAETPDQLWKEYRKDLGVGFRMVTASGAVYRADLLWGDEGFAPTIIVNYPW
ncbi:MAG: hypothetical protein OEW39_03810 [Deltaproteobacteria bacterium]|nr:hypothetical protein [Deltaproteobacteria bacterium]